MYHQQRQPRRDRGVVGEDRSPYLSPVYKLCMFLNKCASLVHNILFTGVLIHITSCFFSFSRIAHVLAQLGHCYNALKFMPERFNHFSPLININTDTSIKTNKFFY